MEIVSGEMVLVSTGDGAAKEALMVNVMSI
jgi:hypothetical protein